MARPPPGFMQTSPNDAPMPLPPTAPAPALWGTTDGNRLGGSSIWGTTASVPQAPPDPLAALWGPVPQSPGPEVPGGRVPLYARGSPAPEVTPLEGGMGTGWSRSSSMTDASSADVHHVTPHGSGAGAREPSPEGVQRAAGVSC